MERGLRDTERILLVFNEPKNQTTFSSTQKSNNLIKRANDKL